MQHRRVLRPLKSARVLFATLVLALATYAPSNAADSKLGKAPMTVFKSPSCGCCGKWVDYMRGHGFSVAVRDMEDLAVVKRTAGVPDNLQSCHTATVEGYVIEGHVPMEAVRRLLHDRPDVRGLAVPGMPIGSPGMEGPGPESYSVYSFDRAGGASADMSVPAD